MYKHPGNEHVLVAGCSCSCRQYLANSSLSAPTPNTILPFFTLLLPGIRVAKGSGTPGWGLGSCWPHTGGMGTPHCPPPAPTQPGENF